MKRLLKDQDGNVFSAEIISSVPDGFTDITDELVPNEDVNGVNIEHLEVVEIPLAPEKWQRVGFTDSSSQPVFEVDTWIKDGQPDLITDPLDETYTLVIQGSVDSRWTLVPAVPAYKTLQKKASWVAHDKNVRVSQAYEAMNSEVLAQMALVFGTTKTDSASAYNETWKMMSSNPSDWSGAGLKSSFIVAGFQIGDVLDDITKVANYANAKLAEALAYGIWRMQRIDSFKNLRDSILAE